MALGALFIARAFEWVEGRASLGVTRYHVLEDLKEENGFEDSFQLNILLGTLDLFKIRSFLGLIVSIFLTISVVIQNTNLQQK